MKKTLKNAVMVDMLMQLKPLLSRRDKIGYAAARNHRRLAECLTEYERFRNSLIEKYGEHEKDENGNELPSISLSSTSPNFKMFLSELAPYNEMEHEVELMELPYSEVIGSLSGEEILAIDWMLVDGEEE
ncbi:hypothetical protein [Acutalibacter sp. JLR.KK004]|jgi:hypothetical protein|uniref:hypothetical protein n=1 Tax=Acutalibacter sp. JLR.KK004 TaxID=3112622 RepID=UPI002FEFDF22